MKPELSAFAKKSNVRLIRLYCPCMGYPTEKVLENFADSFADSEESVTLLNYHRLWTINEFDEITEQEASKLIKSHKLECNEDLSKH